MKTIMRLSLVAILLFSTTIANAQQADSTLYKVKLEKFKAKEKTGKILTISGLALTAIGAGAGYFVGYNQGGPSNDVGWGVAIVCIPVGVISTIWGSIDWSVGHKKVREYTIKLNDFRAGIYYTPDHIAGLKLAFKF